MRRTLLAGVTLIVLLGIGCYTSKFTVGSADQAKVDRQYVGDWEFKDGDKTSHLIIRNLDDKNYYVEMNGDGEKTDRYTAFIGTIKDVQFANLRHLSDDGTIEDERIIMRVGLKDGKLELRNLKDTFFKDQTIESQPQLTSVIEKNLENPAMYDDEPLIATRAAK
jgi:hypothetical protein